MITEGKYASGAIAASLKQYASTHTHVLFMVPGGSATKIALQAIHQLSVDVQKKLVITLTDERFGNQAHAQSNWNAIYEDVKTTPVTTIPILQGESRDNSAIAWSTQLQQYINKNVPIIAVCGVGTDAHIAGLKPNCDYGTSYNDAAVAYTATDFDRISISPEFFSNIDELFIYAEGKQKYEVIEALDAKKHTSHTPILYASHANNLHIYYTK